MIAQRKDTRQGRNKMTSKVSKPRRNEPIKKKQLHVDTDSDEHSSNESIVESEEDYDVDIDDASSSVGDQDNSNDDDSDSSQGKQNNYFTDENSSWLKPKNKKVEKKQLLSSSDDDISDGVVGENGEENSEDFSSDDDDEEEDDGGVEDLLEIERESRLLDKQLAQEEEEAEIELRKMIESSSNTFRLPTTEEIQEEIDGTRVIPPSEIRDRINNIITVLSDFKNRREPNRSRSDYITQLTSDLAELYGYLPDLVEYFLTMFNPSETLEFLEASDSTRPMVIRTNTLKTRRKDLAAALLKRGVTLDPLASWSKVGLKITASTIPIGATPEYLSGHYMLQSAASFCPVLALNPSPSGNEVVLDMSSAPGGKTSYLAQLMRNTGLIIANDLRPERQKATVANMHRLGVRNVITCCHDGRVLGKLWKNRFTKILLDAPCSGLGVISRDPSVKLQRTIKDVDKCAVLQKELLLSAIDALNYKGKDCGIMVYSTCSVSVTENEEVINYLLQKRDVKLLDTGLDFGKPGFTRYQHKRFHPSLALTRRFYPHVHNMDGFYVAKIQKLSDNIPGQEIKEDSKSENQEEELLSPHSSSDDRNASVVESNKEKKKRLSHEVSENDTESLKKRKIDKSKLSVPPTLNGGKNKKKHKSAKTNKPRRYRADNN